MTRAGLIAAIASMAAAGAGAQDAPVLSEGQWYVSPLLSGVFDDEQRLSDPGLGLGLGFGLNFSPHWNAEFRLFGNRLDGYNEVNQHGVGVDFIGMADPAARVVPYGVLGLGYMHTNVVEGLNAPPGRDDDNLAANWGLGIMTRLGDSRALFRIDARQRLEFADPDDLSDFIVNAGFLFPLGAGAPAVADSDGDGVADPADRCPGTPPGAAVDAFGCERDSDGDGVVDRLDKCPGTPPGRRVDANGCEPPPEPQREADSDGDGVPDARDQCPGTPRGVRVDFRGCEIKEEIELPNVNFELESAVLTSDSTATLDGAVSTLNRYRELQVECSGHTDSTGSDAYNQRLSEQRAHSVCEYLVSHGIDRARLQERGYGESRPIADNATEEGRARNRRVTLRITGGS
jgi:OOP family OmpA-OmpF porin